MHKFGINIEWGKVGKNIELSQFIYHFPPGVISLSANETTVILKFQKKKHDEAKLIKLIIHEITHSLNEITPL